MQIREGVNIDKVCERCGLHFECRAGQISECHCREVTLSDEERLAIAAQFRDCVCQACLQDFKNKSVIWNLKSS